MKYFKTEFKNLKDCKNATENKKFIISLRNRVDLLILGDAIGIRETDPFQEKINKILKNPQIEEIINEFIPNLPKNTINRYNTNYPLEFDKFDTTILDTLEKMSKITIKI